MNIWLLHPFAGGPGLGRHWRPFWLADAWRRMGHRPLVVSAAFHHLHREPHAPGPRRVDEVDFWFLETPPYGESGIGRLWNNLSFGPRLRASATEISQQFGPPALVIASTPHLFFIDAAQKVARQFQSRFWVEVRDLWPESIVALGLTSAWNPLVRILDWKERSAYRSADRVVCLLAGAEAHMRSRDLAAGKFLWIPNGVSESEIRSATTIDQMIRHPYVDRIRRMKERGRQVVLYSGGMGPPNAMETIVDAARVVGGTNSRIYFMLVGSGASREKLEYRADDLLNVEFQDEVDRSIVHAMLHESDCAVVSFHKNPLYHFGISPNKLFDYCLFAPRTVIACEQEALSGYEALVDMRCEPGNPAALAEALQQALQKPQRSLQERLQVVEKYSYSRLANRYLDLIQSA